MKKIKKTNYKTKKDQHKLNKDKSAENKFILDVISKNSKDAMEISKKGIHIWVNSSYLKLFGYDNEKEVINKPVLDHIAPSQKKFVLGKIEKHVKGRQINEIYETTGKRKNGEEFSMEISVSIFKFKNENYSLVQFKDISESARIEQKFNSLFNNMVEGVALHELILDNKGKPVNYRLIDINDQYEKIIGIKRKNVIGKLSTEVYKTKEPPYLKEFSKPVLTGIPSQMETYFPPMGKHFFISISPFGEKGFATIFFDITDRKKIDNELKEKSEELDRYFTSSLDLLCIADTEGYFRRLNPEWEKTLGYKLEYLIDKKFLNFVHPDDMSSTLESLTNLKKSKKILNFTNRYRCKDGKYKWIEWRSFLNKNMIYAAARDITEHIQTEKTLKERERLLNESQKIARLGHFVINVLTSGLTVSETMHEIFGINENHLRNTQSWLDLIHPEDKEFMRDNLKELILKKKEKIYYQEYRIIRNNDKQLRWINVNGNVKFDKKGNAVEMFGTIQDITDRKKYENDLKEKSEELKLINKEMEQLIYITSHDLRSPLINIEGFTKELNISIDKLKNMISVCDCDQKIKKSMIDIIKDDINYSQTFILKSTGKMARLLNALLKLSRVGKIDNKMETINMNKLIKKILQSVEYQITSNNIDINVNKLPDCYGNDLQLTQLFSNLIDNAIKYRNKEKKCQILISVKNINNNKIQYIIKDNGIGIPKDNQKRIFELFYRLNPDIEEGEGLGLTIANKIIELHKGRIWVESEKGQGCSFFIELNKNKFN